MPTATTKSAIQSSPACGAASYQRRRPDETTLYQVVQEHVDTFFTQVELETGAGLPQFVKDEFEAFLECGILAHGFLRLRCGACAQDTLVAFSCKRRGFCPACGARRMAETAAHLVDHVIPHVPIRQWVVSFPIPLRHLFATPPHLLSPVLEVINRAIATFLIKQAGLTHAQAQTGAVTLIQRFGSAANLNIHLHCLVLDGVYRFTDGPPVFQAVPAPTMEQLQTLLTRIIKRVMKVLTRKGALREEASGIPYLTDTDRDPALAPLHAAACTSRIALGPRAGQKVLTLKDHALGRSGYEAADPPQGCVRGQGFSLHTHVSCGPHQRPTLERLCRYITRPALGHNRLRRTSTGEVVLQLKTPYRDGTTHVVMAPLEFLQRLAALVPRPRLHLIRFHGVLAPHAALRAQIVPSKPDQRSAPAEGTSEATSASTPTRLSWAQLLKRVFDLDMAACVHCGGPVTHIATIEDPAVIAKILAHLDLPTKAPPRGPAQPCPLFQTA